MDVLIKERISMLVPPAKMLNVMLILTFLAQRFVMQLKQFLKQDLLPQMSCKIYYRKFVFQGLEIYHMATS